MSEDSTLGKQRVWLTFVITSFGTLLEWYEFGIFGYLSYYINVNFFPKDINTMGIIYTYLIFGIGFLARPLGALYYGYIGDIQGRKQAVIRSSLLISISMIIMMLLPTYSYLGAISIVIIILARLFQGFSAGGEYTGTITTIIEHSTLFKKNHRALIASIPIFISNLGFYLALFVVNMLEYMIPSAKMISWGWRLPFLIGAILGLLFYFLRHFINESILFSTPKIKKIPIKELLTKRKLRYTFILISLLSIMTSALYYGIYIFLPDFYKNNLHMPLDLITNIIWIISFGVIILSGWLSDLWGRKFTLILMSLLIALCIVPVLWIGIQNKIIWLMGIPIILGRLIPAPFIAQITETFPKKYRYTGTSVAFNIGTTFAGFFPALFYTAYNLTHSFFSIGFIIAIVMICIVILEFYMPKDRANLT